MVDDDAYDDFLVALDAGGNRLVAELFFSTRDLPKVYAGIEFDPFALPDIPFTRTGEGSLNPRVDFSPRSLLDDLTNITRKGANETNFSTTTTRAEFEQMLVEAGFTPSAPANPRNNAVIYERGGTRYTVRDNAGSTGQPAVDYKPPWSDKPTVKIRLGG